MVYWLEIELAFVVFYILANPSLNIWWEIKSIVLACTFSDAECSLRSEAKDFLFIKVKVNGHIQGGLSIHEEQGRWTN